MFECHWVSNLGLLRRWYQYRGKLRDLIKLYTFRSVMYVVIVFCNFTSCFSVSNTHVRSNFRMGIDEYMQVYIGVYSHRDDRSYFFNYFPANHFAADNNCLKVPEKFDDNQAVLLSDILPTAWHGNELGGVGEGDNVAIWGAGPGKN